MMRVRINGLKTMFFNMQVIGDSSGVITSQKLRDSHGNFLVLEEMQALVGIPVKFVHIITNPFDSIASSVIGQPPSGIKVRDCK